MNKVKNPFKYCNSITEYSRYKTREVFIGDVPLGGKNPIRIQSMTTTDTMNTIDTVEQSIRIINAGSDYVRITAPSINEAKNLYKIKKELKSRGYDTPIIADIHFTPNAAIEAAAIVEKVRINPGNYADKKRFKTFEISDAEYENELNRIYDKFSPLVKVCKENGTAMRIGTNHGSLSDRIMNRYGDTPLGMVESAMEFLRICESHNYFNIVLSMKSSNPIVMVQAYRLLVNAMNKENMFYPLHLGVTEAGEGIGGRIKSSIGIGSLLEDGLGDTIRVSLTEEPEYEIPIAKKIVDRYLNRPRETKIEEFDKNPINPFEYNLRETHSVLNIGGSNVPRIISDLSLLDEIRLEILEELGYSYSKDNDKWEISDVATDYIYIGDKNLNFQPPGMLGVIQDFSVWKNSNSNDFYPILKSEDYMKDSPIHPKLNFVSINLSDLTNDFINKIKNDQRTVLFTGLSDNINFIKRRCIFIKNMNALNTVPIIVSESYKDIPLEKVQINASIDIGGIFIDGLGDGLFISDNSASIKDLNLLSFEILQSIRRRITKTDYISCPSCGRTQFDLMETTAKVREKTSHLKGLKIAVMGCIVNGPGEMADADYGYVGTGRIEKSSRRYWNGDCQKCRRYGQTCR